MKDNVVPTKLYNLAYRLTGDTSLAGELTIKAVNRAIKRGASSLDTDDLFQKAACEISGLLINHYQEQNQIRPVQKDSNYQLQIALNHLPVKERLALVLRDICKFSHVQISIAMGAEKEEVQKLLAQGRSKVIRMLKVEMQQVQ